MGWGPDGLGPRWAGVPTGWGPGGLGSRWAGVPMGWGPVGGESRWAEGPRGQGWRSSLTLALLPYSVCNAGRWVCQDLQCPRTCALEGGAHITTFDERKYTFHGDCYYVLTKVAGTRVGMWVELDPCPTRCVASTPSALPAGHPRLLRRPGRADPLRLHRQADLPEDGGAAG